MAPFAAMGEADAECRRLGSTYAAHGLGHSIDEPGMRLDGDFLARALGAAG